RPTTGSSTSSRASRSEPAGTASPSVRARSTSRSSWKPPRSASSSATSLPRRAATKPRRSSSGTTPSEASVAGPARGRLPHRQKEVAMSRYTITVTRQGRLDPDAVIGYDPPLRTYFLQAFPHQKTDEPALWLGTHDHTLETHEDLHHAAIAHGYDFMPLPKDVAAQLVTYKAQEAGRPPHYDP